MKNVNDPKYEDNHKIQDEPGNGEDPNQREMKTNSKINKMGSSVRGKKPTNEDNPNKARNSHKPRLGKYIHQSNMR